MDNFEVLFKDPEHAALYAAITSRDAVISGHERFINRLKGGLKLAIVLIPVIGAVLGITLR